MHIDPHICVQKTKPPVLHVTPPPCSNTSGSIQPRFGPDKKRKVQNCAMRRKPHNDAQRAALAPRLLYLDCSQITEQKGLRRKMIFHPLTARVDPFLPPANIFAPQEPHGHRIGSACCAGLRRRRMIRRNGAFFICQFQRFGSETQPFSIKN